MSRKCAMVLPLLFLASCSVVDPGRATLDFNALNGSMTEAQAMELNSRLEWRCGDDKQYRHMFGQRACDGLLDALNTVPASQIDYLFRDGQLAAAIVQFAPDSFKEAKAQLDANMGQGGDQVPRTPFNSSFGPDAELLAWKAKSGAVISARKPRNTPGNVVVAWISDKEVARYAGQ
jgi:hypothetical protein